MRSDALLPDIVDSLTIDAAGGDSDEKEKATNPWRGRLPATRTEYYHWGLLQARGRPGELWITRRDSQMSGSTRACKEYGTAVSPYVVGFDRTSLIARATPTELPWLAQHRKNRRA